MKKKARALSITMMALIVVLALSCAVFADGPQAEDASGIPLEVTNKTGMFNVVTASLQYDAGVETLVVELSGTGYHELYKGTYEQAVANGTATENWIHGAVNTNGKWEFRIPLADREAFIPIVAISDRNYNNYLNNKGKLEEAFFPRQAKIDRAAKTIVTDDYNETTDFEVVSNVADFKISDKAATTVVGGPNSNNYSVSPILVMKNSTYDKVTYPTIVSGAVGTASAALKSSKFAISMTNAPGVEAFRDKEPIEMTFHVSSKAGYKEAGKNVKRTVTIDKSAKTITIDGKALTAKKKATISILKKSNVKTVKTGDKALKKAQSFTVKTKASSGAKTTYKKTTKGKISVSTSGKVTLKKGLKKGKYSVKVKVSAATTANYLAASKTITIKVTVK